LASDWNTYVRDNFNALRFGHLVYATSQARGQDISAPVEGIMTFLTSSSAFEVFRSGAWGAAINTASIVDLNVTTDKIDNLAVTTGKINNLAVTEGKIADSAVTSVKIADNTIVAGDLAVALQQLLVPVGTIQGFAGANAPTGWLFCNGDTIPNGSGTVQSVTTDFSGLYAVVDTNFGNPGKLPDLRGRVPIGAGSGAGLTVRTLGLSNTGMGAETTTLSVSHIPEHTHSINHDHEGFNSNPAGGHGHTLQVSDGSGGIVNNNDGVVRSANIQDGGFMGGPVVSYAGDHQHWIDVPNFSGTSGPYGTASPMAVSRMQPHQTVNYIIKY